MMDFYEEPAPRRPLWRVRLEGYLLAGALLGLIACLVRTGWLCLRAGY